MVANMNLFAFLVLGICFIVVGSAKETKSKILSRRKRYVTFPDGSSFSCAGCMTVGLIGQPAPKTVPGTFTFGLNWGIAYELPNATETLQLYHKKLKKPVAMRRNRRELYEKLEAIMDKMGYNGRECILKTLCETTQRLVPHGENIIEEMFRTLFTLPISKILPTEPLEHAIYDSAHRLGVLLESCDIFKCPLSLVDLAQGVIQAAIGSLTWPLLLSNDNNRDQLLNVLSEARRGSDESVTSGHPSRYCPAQRCLTCTIVFKVYSQLDYDPLIFKYYIYHCGSTKKHEFIINA